MKGRFTEGYGSITENLKLQNLDFQKYPDESLKICENLEFCVGLSKKANGKIAKLETIWLQKFVKDDNWTSILSLNAPTTQWEDTNHLKLDLCCRDETPIPEVELGRVQVPMDVSF